MFLPFGESSLSSLFILSDPPIIFCFSLQFYGTIIFHGNSQDSYSPGHFHKVQLNFAQKLIEYILGGFFACSIRGLSFLFVTLFHAVPL